MSVESYHEWIRLVAAFTVHSLESWQWAAASVYYLLGLWSRLVSSLPYLKGEAPSLLETYVPKITQAYLTSRCVAAIGQSHAPDPYTSLRAGPLPASHSERRVWYASADICWNATV